MKRKFHPYLHVGYILFSLLLLMVSTLWIEFKYPFYPTILIIPQIILIMTSWYMFTLLPHVNQNKMIRSITVGIAVVSAIWLSQSIALIINVYQFALPPLFYQLKLFRFITLSTNFFIQPLLLMGGLLFLNHQKTRLMKITWWQLLLLLYVICIVLVQLVRAIDKIHTDTVITIQSLATPFPDRQETALGGKSYYGWIWPYTRFILKHTPSTATIMLPPMSNDWKMEGNPDYLRWYLYPRNLVHIKTDGSIPAEAEYLLIAQGECKEAGCGWPKINISADRISAIFLIDRDSNQETIMENTNFDWMAYKDSWGIIKLKK